jgi:hypothetical protein
MSRMIFMAIVATVEFCGCVATYGPNGSYVPYGKYQTPRWSLNLPDAQGSYVPAPSGDSTAYQQPAIQPYQNGQTAPYVPQVPLPPRQIGAPIGQDPFDVWR